MRSFWSKRFSATETNVRRMLVGGLAAGIIALIIAIGAVALITQRNQAHSAMVRHTFEVELAIQNFRLPMWQAEAARRGYILTGNRDALGVYQETTAELRPALARLARLTRDNTRQGERIARLKALNERIMRMRGDSIAIVDRGAATPALRARWIDESVPVLVAIRAVGREMIEDERRLLVLREGVAQASARTFIVVLGVVGVLVVVLAILIFLTLVRYTSDLTASRDTLRDLADTLEDAVRERTADLTRANEEIQRFAYIVSHDLRAPLVNVMGYTSELEQVGKIFDHQLTTLAKTHPEAIEAEAIRAVREDVPEAVGFIRASTAKMDRLINAILKLSREGRRALVPEVLDMTGLVQSIADSVHHQAIETGGEIVVRDLPELESDRLSIEQIFGNLLDNAVKYQEPGRPVRIVVEGEVIDDGRVHYRVIDNGRGVSERDHERIFELFRRAGKQDLPGEGLGLAFVRNNVRRLGGVMELESELGQGSTFHLKFPTRLIVPGDAGDRL